MFLPASLKYRKRNSFGSQTVLVARLCWTQISPSPSHPTHEEDSGCGSLAPSHPTHEEDGGQKSGSGNETTRLQGHQQFNSVVT